MVHIYYQKQNTRRFQVIQYITLVVYNPKNKMIYGSSLRTINLKIQSLRTACLKIKFELLSNNIPR